MRFIAGALFALIILFAAAAVEAATPNTIVACKTGVDRKSTIALLAETSVDGKRLSLKFEDSSQTPPRTTLGKAFTDMPDADFVGAVAMSRCVEGTLVFALDYGTPYRKGAAVRMRSSDNAVQRLDFAEKALPQWLYVNATAMSVVIPNIGTESRAKYLHYVTDTISASTAAPTDADLLPAKKGFVVKRLR
jgi:hypothetical protein